MDINQIKKLRDKGKKKWSPQLIKFITPKIKEGYSYERIAQWLSDEYDFKISNDALKQLMSRFKKKQVTPSSPVPQESSFTTETKKEIPLQNVVQKKETRSIEELGMDFRRKTPEPRKLE